jgi:hypothetical protein
MPPLTTYMDKPRRGRPRKPRSFPRSAWRPAPGPVVLVGSNPKTSPFASQDAELVATWLKQKYNLHTVLVVEATPTHQWVSWPFWGWRRTDGKN